MLMSNAAVNHFIENTLFVDGLISLLQILKRVYRLPVNVTVRYPKKLLIPSQPGERVNLNVPLLR
jgi:hypothetical protein